MTAANIKEALAFLPDGITILEAVRDSNNRIIDFKWMYTNATADEIHGEPFKRIAQSTLFKKVPSLQSYLSKFVDVVEKAESFEHEFYDQSIGKWLHGRYKKYHDGFIASLQDITNKKIAEEKLKESELKFATLFENSGVGIGVINNKGEYVMVNDKLAGMFRCNKQYFIGKNLKKFYATPDTDDSSGLFYKLLNREINSYEVEKVYKRKDGTTFCGLVTVSLFQNTKENALAIGIIQDIDARKKAEEDLVTLYKKLIQVNADKDRLLSILAHDLRDPVSSMMQFLFYILERFEEMSKEEMLPHLKLLQSRSTVLYEMLEELLLWAQNQLNHLPFSPGELNVSSSVSKVVSLLEATAREKNIHIETRLGDIPAVKADPNMFNAIVRNLLTNAIKFSPENEEIIVSSRYINNYVWIGIIDHGIGMDNETVNKILNSKVIKSKYGTKGEKGIGIGLGLCKDFIEKHGGELQIRSSVNEGSNFSFYLPVFN
jgi:PAS domain S-box-containing protein